MSAALLASFDALVCDLDGVVYRGATAVPGAVDALRRVTREGRPIAYATNNASRPPAVVAQRLRDLGLSVDVDQVVTSAQAGARALGARMPSGTPVLAVGGPGVAEALRDVGLAPVTSATEGVAAVLQGFGAEVGWSELAEAAYAVASGAVWVATNTDRTLPTERGQAPGNGTLVQAVAAATGHEPEVVGKPHAPLYELALSVLGTGPERTLAVGDRLDTDIAGAHAAGLAAVHVLTGVDGLPELVEVAAERRPRYVVAGLESLHRPYAEPQAESRSGDAVDWRCGGAVLRIVADPHPRLVVGENKDPEELLRATLAAVWHELDAGRLHRDQARPLLADVDVHSGITRVGAGGR